MKWLLLFWCAFSALGETLVPVPVGAVRVNFNTISTNTIDSKLIATNLNGGPPRSGLMLRDAQVTNSVKVLSLTANRMAIIGADKTITNGAPGVGMLATYDTVADLVASHITPLSVSAVVNGRVTINDGGGGIFFYAPSSVVTTNTGTIFPSSSTGRWLRQFGGPLSAAWFGTRGNGNLMQGAGTIAASSSSLTVAGGAFTSADIGKVIIVGAGDALGSGPDKLVSTIQSVGSATQITTAAASAYNLNSVNVVYGSDDSAALQAMFNSLTDTGASIVFRPGIYMAHSLSISAARITLSGLDATTRLYKCADDSSPLLTVTGEQFQIGGIRVEEPLGFVNTAPSLFINNVSDAVVTDCWFFGGYDQLKLSYGNDHLISQCLFESARHHGVWSYQSSVLTIDSSRCYTGGLVDDEPSNITAGVYVSKDPSYSFQPHDIAVTGCEFYNLHYAHGINLSEVTGAALVGNTFHLSGTFNPGTKDDIKLATASYISVAGNISASVNNPYIPGNRATRYCLNISNTNCNNVTPIANSFQAGLLGIINMQAVDTVSLGLVATNGSVVYPVMSMPNNYYMVFRDSANGVGNCAGLSLGTDNVFHILAGNSTLKGISIDTNGNSMIGTVTPLGRFTVAGTGVFGSNGKMQLYDSSSTAIFQTPGADWNFFNSSAGASEGYLTAAGAFTVKRLTVAGTAPTSPNASALVDLQSTALGFLPPRMTVTQRDAIASPADGLLLYQTDSTPGLYERLSGAWVGIGTGSTGILAPAFATLTDGATITLTCDSSKTTQNATVTLGGNRTLAISGAVNGMTGVLIVKQDATGSRTLTLPATSKVVGGGAGTVTLTATAAAVDILTWVYDGSNYYWTYGTNFN